MKLFVFKLVALFFAVLQFVCCKEITPSSYLLSFPQIPEPWIELLGEPCWQIEWFGVNGKKHILSILPEETGKIEVEIPLTWANPVTAFPYWSDRDLFPGLFKPAGAIYPFDVSANRLCLSWEGGADSVFYWELARADYQKNSVNIPANFDWHRYRELFTTEILNEEICKDRWIVDWRSVAEKTAASGFDRRRFVPQKTEPITIPLADLGNMEVLWYGTSPFASPLFFNGKEAVFPACPSVDVWVSSEGILRISGKTWLFKSVSN